MVLSNCRFSSHAPHYHLIEVKSNSDFPVKWMETSVTTLHVLRDGKTYNEVVASLKILAPWIKDYRASIETRVLNTICVSEEHYEIYKETLPDTAERDLWNAGFEARRKRNPWRLEMYFPSKRIVIGL